MENATVEAFSNLFRGRTDAWGSVEGRSNKEKVTRAHYERHLNGEESLGVYPLLDNGECHFFAVDLDEKDINKALAIRSAFAEMNVNVYLAFSKSKGFHCYGFGQEPFKATEVRRLCHAVLAKLDYQCEVFPKQDFLDEQIPLGNYINLPCFGGNSRMFFTTQKTAVSVEDVVKRIRRVPADRIRAALESVPAVPKPTVIKAKKGRPKKIKSPPCIEEILKGVAQPGRDEAAFALARHYLDQGYIEEEVFTVLQQWDTRNRPPLNDPHLLQIKVRSAAKGYAFGCSSIRDNPNLSEFCCGEENCLWLKALNEEKKKKGLIREQSFHETETHLYEEVVQDGSPMFAIYDKQGGQVTYDKVIAYPDFTIMPIVGGELIEGVVQFPEKAEVYGDTSLLKNEIKSIIQDYVDLDEQHTEYAAWYVLGSWVYDRLNTISYLRFLGDTGTGKSRALDVVGELCYKPLMMAGAVTPAPMYREIRRFRGTLILEEADFKDTTEKNEVVTILNCGIERGRSVLRCSNEDPNIIEVLPCYGPKVFATRLTFTDKALESRCYTCVMKETVRQDIPPLLGTKFQKRALEIRNKLLLWRFHNYERVNPDSVEDIDLGPVEPRLKQLGLPFAIPFMHLPEVMADFRNFLLQRQDELIQERADSDYGEVVRAIMEIAQEEGTQWIAVSDIAEHITTDQRSVTSQKVGRLLKSLDVKRTKKMRSPTGKIAVFIIWEEDTMRVLAKRYILEIEDFRQLFPMIDTINAPYKIDMEV